MPAEPPTWRIELITAEPTPALSTGTDPIAADVVGAIAIAIPNPPTTSAGRSDQKLELSSFWSLLPALVVGGFGMAMAMAPTTSAAMGSVPVDKAGVGSAVINSMRQVGGSAGIALAGVFVAAYGIRKVRALPAHQRAAAAAD